MKKLTILAVLATVLNFSSFAQTPYRTSLGLGVDLGKGFSMFGPQVKHVFGKNAALQAQVMFSDDDYMYLGADYQYIQSFPDTRALAWYIGVGPQIGFRTDGGDYTDFVIRPQAGLDIKLPEVPIGIHFDWKPWWRLNHGGYFTPKDFSLGFKYIIK